MYTLQAPAIHTALTQGGVAPAQASQIQNLFGQCRQPLEHRGPVKIDYTSPDMRLVTPEVAKQRYPTLNLNPPEGLGRRRGGGPQRPPEEKPRPGPGGPFVPNPEPELPELPRIPEYTGGDYIEVADQKISLIADDRRRHPVFADNKKSIQSVTFVSKSDNEEVLALEIDERNRDTEFALRFEVGQITYIKSIRLDVDNNKLYIERGSAYAFKPTDIDPISIPLVVCETDSGSTP